jgi:hypothetical protein
LLNAISEANSEFQAPNIKQSKPKLHKRDTDSVLSSILSSIAPSSSPPSYTTSHSDLSEADSINSDSDADSPTVRLSYNIDDTRPGYSTGDSLQRLSSGSSEGKRLSDSSSDKLQGKARSVESSNSDYEDMNVFDMLQDNSEMVINMLEESDDIGSYNRGYVPSKLNGTVSDVPPPVPTTPIPSDDDEEIPAPPPRRESLLKSSDDGWSSGDSDFSTKPKLNGFVTLQSR